MECHAEFLPDQLGDASGGPQVGAEAEPGGFLEQPGANLGMLLVGRESRATGAGLGGDGFLSAGPIGGHALGHRHRVDAEEFGDVGLRASRTLRMAGVRRASWSAALSFGVAVLTVMDLVPLTDPNEHPL